MSEWKTISATDFCDSVRDGTHDTPKPTLNGFKLVTGKHLKNGVIDTSDAYYISESDYNKINERSKVEQWDVLLSMIGTVGEVAVVKKQPDYAIKNIALFKCAGSELKGKWLAYYLRSPKAKGFFSGNQKGSSQQFLSLKQLRNLPIVVADESYMKYVVDTLSRYDSLIENYQKQIKLLEEAAQRLYKEWFVDFHFPGHENAKIVDGVPEGWEKNTLEDICSLSKRVIQLSDIKEGCPYIGLEHMPQKDFCLSKWGNSDEINSSKYEYKEGDILFGKIRPYFHKVGFAINDGYASTDSIIMQSKPRVWALLLMTVFSEHFVNYTSQTCKEGAKMPRADWNQMKKYPVFIASDTIQKEFERQCKLITYKIKANALQIRLLTEARDRLLPKLMNGEIAV